MTAIEKWQTIIYYKLAHVMMKEKGNVESSGNHDCKRDISHP
jgi:hypothetical protein